MAGPKMNPNPKAMPMRPIFLDRSSGGLMSAMYAWATVMLPPNRPASMRERIISSRAASGRANVALSAKST